MQELYSSERLSILSTTTGTASSVKARALTGDWTKQVFTTVKKGDWNPKPRPLRLHCGLHGVVYLEYADSNNIGIGRGALVLQPAHTSGTGPLAEKPRECITVEERGDPAASGCIVVYLTDFTRDGVDKQKKPYGELRLSMKTASSSKIAVSASAVLFVIVDIDHFTLPFTSTPPPPPPSARRLHEGCDRFRRRMHRPDRQENFHAVISSRLAPPGSFLRTR